MIGAGKTGDDEAEPWEETAESHCYSLIAGVEIEDKGGRKPNFFPAVSKSARAFTSIC